jgi:hypothetical protein
MSFVGGLLRLALGFIYIMYTHAFLSRIYHKYISGDLFTSTFIHISEYINHFCVYRCQNNG